MSVKAPRPRYELAPSVFDFGARGDGLSDDTTALQTALTAAGAAGGGLVYLPPGTYKITSGLTFPRQQVNLFGAGYACSIIDATSLGAGTAISVGNGSTYNDWGSLEDLQVQSNANAALTLLSVNAAHRGLLRKVMLKGLSDPVGSFGAHFLNADTQKIEDCIFTSTNNPLYLETLCNEIEILSTTLAGAGVCLRILNSHTVRVRGGQISNGSIGVQIDCTVAQQSDGIQIENVDYESNTLDLQVGDTGTSSQAVGGFTQISSPMVDGCKIDRATDAVLVSSPVGGGGSGVAITITANADRTTLINCRKRTNGSVLDSGTNTNIVEGETGVMVTGKITARENATGQGFVYAPATAVGQAITAQVVGETQARFLVNHSGLIQIGPGGSTGPDVTLGRVASRQIQLNGVYQSAILNPAYSASITPVANSPWQTITVTNATAFTINAPTSPPDASHTQQLTVEILNSSGGVMGAITWNAAFLLVGGAFTNPASTKKRFIRFEWNGANWVEISRAGADY